MTLSCDVPLCVEVVTVTWKLSKHFFTRMSFHCKVSASLTTKHVSIIWRKISEFGKTSNSAWLNVKTNSFEMIQSISGLWDALLRIQGLCYSGNLHFNHFHHEPHTPAPWSWCLSLRSVAGLLLPLVVAGGTTVWASTSCEPEAIIKIWRTERVWPCGVFMHVHWPFISGWGRCLLVCLAATH